MQHNAKSVNVQVITFAGELLGNAEALLRDGLHTSEVAEGYSKAAQKVVARWEGGYNCFIMQCTRPISMYLNIEASTAETNKMQV